MAVQCSHRRSTFAYYQTYKIHLWAHTLISNVILFRRKLRFLRIVNVMSCSREKLESIQKKCFFFFKESQDVLGIIKGNSKQAKQSGLRMFPWPSWVNLIIRNYNNHVKLELTEFLKDHEFLMIPQMKIYTKYKNESCSIKRWIE